MPCNGWGLQPHFISSTPWIMLQLNHNQKKVVICSLGNIMLHSQDLKLNGKGLAKVHDAS